jgi:hypothetical protein
LIERKVAGILQMSNELARSVSRTAMTLFSKELKKACAVALNQDFLGGLIGNTGIASFASEGTDVSDIAYDARRALGALEYGADSKLYWVGGPDIAKALATTTGPGGRVFPTMGPQGGEYFGAPFLVSDEAGEGNLILLDASQIAADSLALTMRVSGEASVAMSDNPEAEGNLVSLWQTHQSAILVERHYGFELLRDSALAVVTDVDYGPAESA